MMYKGITFRRWQQNKRDGEVGGFVCRYITHIIIYVNSVRLDIIFVCIIIIIIIQNVHVNGRLEKIS